MMLLTDGDNPTVVRFLTKFLLSPSHIRCCKLVPGSLNRCLCIVTKNGIMPGFTNQYGAIAKTDA